MNPDRDLEAAEARALAIAYWRFSNATRALQGLPPESFVRYVGRTFSDALRAVGKAFRDVERALERRP